MEHECRQDRTIFLIIVLVLTIAAVLTRFYGISRLSLWIDEGSTFYYSHYTWSQFYTANEPNSPVYYIMEGYVLDCMGQNEFSLRFISALLGSLTVPVAYFLGMRIFNNQKSAILTAIFFLVSPVMIYYSQEARGYMPVVFLFLCQALVLTYAIERKCWAYWILLSVISAVQFSMQFTGVIATLILYLYALFHDLINKQGNLLKILISGILFLIISYPLIGFAYDTLLIGTSHEHWSWCKIGVEYLVNAMNHLLFCNNLAMAVFIILTIIGLYLCLKDHVEHTLLLLIAAVVPLLLTTVISYKSNMTPRYILWSASGFYFLAAYCYSRIDFKKTKRQIATVIVLAFVLLVSVTMLPACYTDINKEDFRGAAMTISENAKPGDVMVYAVNSENSVYASLAFYYDAPANGVSVFGYTGEEQLHSLVLDPSYGDIYVVILFDYAPIDILSKNTSGACTNIFTAYGMNVFKLSGIYW